MSGLKRIRGLLWPEMDRDCSAVIFKQMDSIGQVLRHVKDSSICIQAGGNVGLWPIELSKTFRTVYTFEPEPRNYQALLENIKDHSNITAAPCALGDKPGLVSMHLDKRERRNCGAFFVQQGGDIPVILIDELRLPSCGLIYLDVEGFEEQALRGAKETISRHKPVISIESKGLAKRYGLTNESCINWVRRLGYEIVDRSHRDVILAPC